MKKKIIIVSILAATLIVAGCTHQKQLNIPTVAPSSSESSDTTNIPNNQKPITDNEGDGHIVTPAGSRVSVSNINSFKKGQNTIAFKLFGIDSHEFGDKDLRTFHDKKLHLIIVRDDMQDFMHIHPEYKDSKWTVGALLNLSGAYNMYLDFDPLEEKPTVLRVPFNVDSETYTKDFPRITPDMKIEVDGYVATLVLGSSPKTNETVKLDYLITKDGKPVENIKPYLGAYGHAVMFRQTDVDDYFHVHALDTIKPTQGTVRFETDFPLIGRYTIFGQFNINDKVVTFPITIDVLEEGSGAESEVLNLHQ